jgi:hypothetical protein
VTLLAAYYQRKEPSLWGRPFCKAVGKRIYGRYAFGSGSAPTSLNRHGILHGEISDFGTEANSLKVFLLLDTIQNFYKVIQRQRATQAAAKAAAHSARLRTARITIQPRLPN